MVSPEPAIPQVIRRVVDFLNTIDLRTYGDFRGLIERDELADPATAASWLRNSQDVALTEAPPADVAALRDLRERLRATLRGDGPMRINASVACEIGARPTIVYQAPGSPTEALEARLVEACLSPDWPRLRVCAAGDCRRAFYDTSRNGRAQWCSMTTCGNRMKTRAYRRRQRAATTSTPPAPRQRQVRTNTFRREGDYWTVASARTTFRLKDSKGLAYLARLISEPNREFHVLDLVGGANPKEIASRGSGPADALLDAEARGSYKARLRDLEAEIAEAEVWNDVARLSTAREEMRFLAAELQRSLGLSGRNRSFGSDSERARVSATRVIKAALDRIGHQSPELKHHFASTVRTGTYCSYNPDPRLPVRWQL